LAGTEIGAWNGFAELVVSGVLAPADVALSSRALPTAIAKAATAPCLLIHLRFIWVSPLSA
jgi:hypothetical protein